MEVLQPEWDFYFCNVEGKLASIMLDLALQKVAPIPARNCLVQVAVDLQSPDERELTTRFEAEKLFVMEDMLAEQMASNLQGIYVARNTSSGKRTFFYYAAAMVGFQGVIDEVMGSFPDYSYASQAFSDPEWAMYNQFLYPTPQEFQSILNRRALDQLQENGARMDEPLKLLHHFDFGDREMRKAFIKKAKEKNFIPLYDPKNQKGNELVLTREDKLESNHLEKVTTYLLSSCQKFQGIYKGWKIHMNMVR